MPQNNFLSSLTADDFAALKPYLRLVDLKRGQTLIEQDEVAAEAHFPLDAQLTNVIVLQDGSALETSLIGQEGVSGLAPIMADVPCGWRVAVRVAGEAYVLNVGDLRRVQKASETFMKRCLELASFYEAQAAQSAACNVAHKTEARLARWLLTADDLTPGSALHFTQEEMAALLGAQRTTVNSVAGTFKASKMIRYLRGVITILDRERLEKEACECYGALRQRAVAMNVAPPATGANEDGNPALVT